MPVIFFVFQLFAGQLNLLGINDNDEITGINVRGKDGFMLSAQAMGDLDGKSSQCLALGIDKQPVLLDFVWFGAIAFHGVLLFRKIKSLTIVFRNCFVKLKISLFGKNGRSFKNMLLPGRKCVFQCDCPPQPSSRFLIKETTCSCSFFLSLIR